MSTKLEALFKRYTWEVEHEAAAVFQKHVLPWLEKRKCRRFFASMGTVIIEDSKGNIIHDPPKHVTQFIDKEVPGFPTMSLGEFMPEWRK